MTLMHAFENYETLKTNFNISDFSNYSGQLSVLSNFLANLRMPAFLQNNCAQSCKKTFMAYEP